MGTDPNAPKLSDEQAKKLQGKLTDFVTKNDESGCPCTSRRGTDVPTLCVPVLWGGRPRRRRTSGPAVLQLRENMISRRGRPAQLWRPAPPYAVELIQRTDDSGHT